MVGGMLVARCSYTGKRTHSREIEMWWIWVCWVACFNVCVRSRLAHRLSTALVMGYWQPMHGLARHPHGALTGTDAEKSKFVSCFDSACFMSIDYLPLPPPKYGSSTCLQGASPASFPLIFFLFFSHFLRLYTRKLLW